MVRPIEMEELRLALNHLHGQSMYLHLEVTPGGFVRNVQAYIKETVLRCDGSTYRLALRCDVDGWVVMEGLTHMSMSEQAPLMLCTLADEDRITRLIQISKEMFTA